jgi:hypothetical protein
MAPTRCSRHFHEVHQPRHRQAVVMFHADGSATRQLVDAVTGYSSLVAKACLQTGPTRHLVQHNVLYHSRCKFGKLAGTWPKWPSKRLRLPRFVNARRLVPIRLFQQATSCSIGACHAHRFQKPCRNSSRGSLAKQLARSVWRSAAGPRASSAHGAGTRVLMRSCKRGAGNALVVGIKSPLRRERFCITRKRR